MKRLILILTILLLITTSFAQESANIEDSYDWLRRQEPTSIFEMSLAALALNNVDTASAQPIIQWIKEQQDLTEGCFPKDDCTIKDTSLAIIILSQEGWDTTTAEQWLLSQQKTNTAGGIYLQVITEETGTCNIEYTPKDAQVPVSKEISVDQGEISSAACPTKSTFFNLGTCLQSNLFGNTPSLPTKILCRDLGDAKISLIYKDNNAYYIVYSSLSNTIEDLTLNMGYFGNYEDTLYANWALQAVGSNTNSITWLKKHFSPGNIRDNALIYVITEQEPYIFNLITLQNKNTGSFGSAFETGLACNALTKYGSYGIEAEQARKWLDSRQLRTGDNKGSWNGKIIDTATALYGCYSNEAVNLPPCTDPECYPIPLTGQQVSEEVEEQIVCIDDTDCSIGEECTDGFCQETTEEICNFDGVCDATFGEDQYNCPTDCEAFEPEPTDQVDFEPEPFEPIEERGGGFFWLIIIILILILILAAAYYFLIMKPGKSLSSLFKKKKKVVRPQIRTPAYRRQAQRQPPYRSVRKPKPTKVESELKKSLEEAKKLLKK